MVEEDTNPQCEGEGCPYCAPGELPECMGCAYGVCEEHGEEYKPVTLEAHGLVFGARGADYGHPLDDFSRTAAHWTAHLEDILRPGCEIVAEDVGPMMILMKLSRQRNSKKRDNMTDTAGYAETTQRVIAERARRARLKATENNRRGLLVEQIAASTKDPSATFALLGQLLQEEHDRASSV